MNRAIVLSLTLSISACGTGSVDSQGGEETTGEETTGEETTGEETTGEETTGEGDCFDVQDDTLGPEPYVCGLDTPCDVVVQEGFDPVAAECTLDGIAAGTIGDYSLVKPAMLGSETWRVQVFGDGNALVTFRSEHDDSFMTHVSARAIPPQAFFDACDASSFTGMTQCINLLFEEACVLEPTC
ncbi:Cell surface protein [Enhygromyxa salina]|uniref:Cell surface protein n=1 Tax=Enhygromyxa salina TaxID=215803 RepID=A0A0C2CK61_9BACT|nr:hypothetical protein [Enhygromyxa salina]KIG11621.1 Cell surface protein [Enhygromyxa salina]